MPEPITLLGFAGGTAAVAGHLARRHFEIAKECMDILFGAIALVLVFPLILVCALIIKLSSRGPVFYSQIRVGKRGHLFRLYKLRTMFINAETTQGAVWAEKDDPRVVPWCRWMRRCHVDELPQLLNVLKGQMSMVGPRPLIMDEMKFSPSWRDARLRVKPGITGLWQVQGRSDAPFHDWIRYDVEYVMNQSLWMDIKILLRTIKVVLKKVGAH